MKFLRVDMAGRTIRTEEVPQEYPREIEFVKEIPMTVTGKVKRSELRKIEMNK